MAENSLSQVTSISNEKGLNFLEYQGEILFSSEEIGRQLGYSQPSKSINILFNRNQKELTGYTRHIKLMCRDGQLRESRCFTEEGVYIISMLANTPKARDFRARLALLLREWREQRIELAREAGYQQGFDEAHAFPAAQESARLIWSLGPKQKRRLRFVVRYRAMGLGIHSIAKLLEVNKREISTLLKAAQILNLLQNKPAIPQQGVLL